MTGLVVGATESMGRLVVEKAVSKGHALRALARDAKKAQGLFPGVDVVAADLTRPATLREPIDLACRRRPAKD